MSSGRGEVKKQQRGNFLEKIIIIPMEWNGVKWRFGGKKNSFITRTIITLIQYTTTMAVVKY